MACPSCGHPLREPAAPQYSTFVACLLSFFVPGLGQFYTNRILSGVVFLAVVGGLYAVGILGGALTGGILGCIFLPVGLLLHLMCLLDAGWGAS